MNSFSLNLQWKKLGFVVLALTAVLAVSRRDLAFAQVSAAISGTIKDASGAAIPGATVTVTSLETGAARNVTSDDAGVYRVLSLPVGRYEVRAEKTGFKAEVDTGITLVVGQQAVVSLKLEVGAVQQEIKVTAEATLVNTTTASVSGLVGEKQVKDLPLNGRSFDNLITLNASAINYTSHTTAAATGSGLGAFFSVSGRRPGENLFLLNGVEYTGASIINVTPGGASGQLLGIDAVREFNVVSDAYSAEYGKRAGAQVTVVTQSGANQLHGSVFEFLRNSDLDARNFFDFPPGLRIPPFKRNQFGGSAGGPIRKDKTFVFGSYEGFRQRLGVSDVTLGPDANARKGMLPCNSITVALPAPCPASGVATVPGLNQAMLPYMSFWPEPNGPNLGGGVAETFSNPNQSVREDFGTARFDQNFSNKDNLSAVYTVDDGINIAPSADPLFGITQSLRAQVLSVQETHVFSPSVLNTFTAGFSRAGFHLNASPLVSFPSSVSFVTGKPPGAIVIGGSANAGSGASSLTTAGPPSNSPFTIIMRDLFTYQDGIQVIKGKHQISAGIWFQHIGSNELNPSRYWGSASFTNLQSFLQGTVGTFTVAAQVTPQAWRSLEGAWYVQDAIQLRPNLSVRVGLRHEFTNGWNEGTGRSSNFVFDPNGLVRTAPMIGTSAYTENNAKWLLSPRIGLAWDPFGKGKTSIRAGLGTYYSLLDVVGWSLEATPPFNGTASFSNVPLSSLVPIASGVPAPPGCGPGVPAPCTTYQFRGIQPSAKTPTVQSWNLTVEQQLTANTAVRVAYVGSHGTHQIVTADANQLYSQICSNPAGCTSGGSGSARGTVPQGTQYFPVGGRPNPYLSYALEWFTKGNTSYNALQVGVTRRLSQGLQVRGTYTWSKNLDLGSGLSGSQSVNQPSNLLDTYNPRRDWGPSALNTAQQASGSFSYELPIGQGKAWLNGASGVANKLASGWQVNGILTLLSGFPLTPQVGSNQSGNGDGYNPDRPNVNPAFSGPVTLGSPNGWFNPNAYLLPTPGTYGNLGRGVLTGPGLATLDFSLFKNTRITERARLEFRAEFFNILNRANFSTPNPIIFSSGKINPTAGLVTSTVTTSRQIQFGLKLIF